MELGVGVGVGVGGMGNPRRQISKQTHNQWAPLANKTGKDGGMKGTGARDGAGKTQL